MPDLCLTSLTSPSPPVYWSLLLFPVLTLTITLVMCFICSLHGSVSYCAQSAILAQVLEGGTIGPTRPFGCYSILGKSEMCRRGCPANGTSMRRILRSWLKIRYAGRNRTPLIVAVGVDYGPLEAYHARRSANYGWRGATSCAQPRLCSVS